MDEAVLLLSNSISLIVTTRGGWGGGVIVEGCAVKPRLVLKDMRTKVVH